MYVKLVVVHITVLVAYAHLRHLRRESRSPLHYLFVIACPLAFGVILISPMFAILIQAYVYRHQPRKLKESIAFLLGRLPKGDTTTDTEEIISWPPKLSSKLIRRVVAVTLLLAQSITSLWLFSRRVNHGGVALYDQRIFQLAVLGTCTSAMSIVQLILNPRILDRLSDPPCPTRWLYVFRPEFANGLQELVAESDAFNLGDFLRFIVEWLFTVILLQVGITSGFNSPCLFLMTDVLRVLRLMLEAIVYNIPYIFAFLTLVVLQFRKLLIPLVRGYFLAGSGWLRAVKVLAGIAGLLLAPFVLTIISLIVFSVFGKLFNPIMSGFQLYHLFGKSNNPLDYDLDFDRLFCWEKGRSSEWDQIWKYGHAAPDQPCPKAWKDPQADYVWWLA